VSSGLEAIELLEHQPCDIVLLDTQLRDMDGLAVARYICQKWPSDQRPYMIGVSADTTQGTPELCQAAGMDDYISKPIRLEVLVDAIERSRSFSSGWQSLPGSALALPDESSTRDQTAIDTRMLAEIRKMLGENGAQLLSDMIVSYYDDTLTLLEMIQLAVAQADRPALGRAAHKLKSSSAFFGATTLAHLCNELETLSEAGTIANCGQHAQQIETEYVRVRTALDLERNRTQELQAKVVSDLRS
jgi:CheY-like chemotaxis protein